MIISMIVCVLFLATFLIFGQIYGINDDRAIIDIISGKYTGSGSTEIFYVSQIVLKPLCFLYSIFPSIPFYGIFLDSVVLFSLFLICYYLLNFKNKKEMIISTTKCVIFLILVFLYQTIMIEYTIVTCFPLCALILMLAKFNTFKTKNEKIYFFVMSGVLIMLSAMIRLKVCLLAIPFIGLVLIYKIIVQKWGWKNMTILCSIFLCIVSVVKCVDVLAINSSESFKEYKEYNDVRTEICDHYGFPKYEEAKELYDELGISESFVENMGQNAYLFETDELSLDNLKKIAEYQKSKESIWNNVKNSFGNLIKKLFNIDYSILPTYFILMVLLFCYMLLRIKKYSKYDVLFLLALFLGALVLNLVIIAFMKFAGRVFIVILLYTMFSFLMIFKNNIEKRTLHLIFNTVIVLCVFIVGSYLLSYNFSFFKNNKEFEDIKDKIEFECKENEDYIYFCSNSLVNYLTGDVLKADNVTVKNWYHCDWGAHSEYDKMKLKNLGYDSLSDMLQNQEKLRIVFYMWEEDYDKHIKQYFEERFGRELIQIEQTKEPYEYLNKEIVIFEAS